jgi:hypothetical protein
VLFSLKYSLSVQVFGHIFRLNYIALTIFNTDNGKGKSLTNPSQVKVHKLETGLKKPTIALVVPAYNESGNLKPCLDLVNQTTEK